MPLIHKKITSKHSDEKLFNVVNDVERYPEFIEWCHQVDLLKKTDTLMQAQLHLQKGLLKHNFATENTLKYPNSMQMRLLSGPFKRFAGEWKFTQKNESVCDIEFVLDYEFSNRLLEISVGAIFFRIADEMVNTFIHRADTLYP